MTDAADKETEGRPESFRHKGYLATEKDKRRYDSAASQVFKNLGYSIPEVEHPVPLPRANLIIVREHLQKAMLSGLSREALGHVIAAIKEIER